MSSPKIILASSLLRAADIRGVAGEVLTVETAELIGKAFGTILRNKNQTAVFVGGDGRLSTPELLEALIKGLLSCGINVTHIGTCPTPTVYFATQISDIACGIMVTASHNPKEYNGFKMVVEKKPFFGESIQELGKIADTGSFAEGKGSLTKTDITSQYIKRLVQDFHPDGKELTVVWDCGNGTAGTVVPELIQHLPGRHILLNEEVDGSFPIRKPDSSHAEDLTELSKMVLKEKADIGFAFDGDSDRLGVITSDGEMLETDKLLQIFAEDILKTHPAATIVIDIKSSKTFASEVSRMGGKPLIWKTGHSFIKQKMNEVNAPLGGEMSGHICFADKYYGYDDALYAAIRLLDIVSHMNKESLLDRVKRIPQTFATPELQIASTDEEKFQYIEKIKQRLRAKNIPFEETDGIKVVHPSGGWWLLRASNTSSFLIGRCEADTAEELEQLKNEFFSYIIKQNTP